MILAVLTLSGENQFNSIKNDRGNLEKTRKAAKKPNN